LLKTKPEKFLHEWSFFGNGERKRGGSGFVGSVPDGSTYVNAKGSAKLSAAPQRDLRVGAIDGVRALAIAVVIAYHADLEAFPGGFLGVEVFFVLSGYLVGGALLNELRRRDRIDVKRYALRRMQRLAPALLAMLAVVGTVVLLGFRGEVGHVRRGAIGAVTGTGNWLELASGGDYFAAFGRGPVLRHLWSFSVEVQAYAILPFLVWALWIATSRRRERVAAALTALGFASYAWQAIVAHQDPTSSRAYFGTDTRIGAILLGGALACVGPKLIRKYLTNMALNVAGWLSLASLAVLVAVTEGTDRHLYNGMLALTAMLSTVMIAAAANAGSDLFNRFMSSPPLRWLGTRSYGMYLWHWPIFVLTRPIAGIPMAPLPFAVRVGLTALLAEGSFRYVETTAAPTANRAPWSRRRLTELAAAALAGCLVFGIATATATPARSTGSVGTLSSDEFDAQDAALDAFDPTALLLAPSTVVSPPQANSGNSTSAVPTIAPANRAGVSGSSVLSTGLSSSSTTTIPRNPSGASTGEQTPSQTTLPIVAEGTAPTSTPAMQTSVTTTTAVAPLAIGSEVTMIGDSLMETATLALQARFGPDIVVDTQVGRQFTSGIERANALRYDGKLKPIVIIGLGTNGPFSEKQIEALIAELSDRKTIAFVKVVVPRRWQKTVNEALDKAKERHPEILLIDWPAWVSDYKVRLQDGVHPTVRGARLYAELMATALTQTPITPVSVQTTTIATTATASIPTTPAIGATTAGQ
jgi:peptidoglycan/LPS O-acetylase OafA/YrhL